MENGDCVVLQFPELPTGIVPPNPLPVLTCNKEGFFGKISASVAGFVLDRDIVSSQTKILGQQKTSDTTYDIVYFDRLTIEQTSNLKTGDQAWPDNPLCDNSSVLERYN